MDPYKLDLLSINEASELFGVPKQTIKRKLWSGEFKGRKFNQRCWMVHRYELERYTGRKAKP
jgi:Helix-turn-helix domain